MALAFVMALCLLVYTLGQRQLRQALQHAQQTLPNQLGKATHRPTLRWIFSVLYGRPLRHGQCRLPSGQSHR